MHVLHDEVDVLLRVYSFIQLAYVLVIQTTLNANLTDGLLLSLNVDQLKAIVYLDCHPLTSGLMNGFFDHSVSTVANLSAKVILSEVRTIWSREFVLSRRTHLVMVVIETCLGAVEIV